MCGETVCPSNTRKYTHKVSPTQQFQNEQIEDHIKEDRDKPIRSQTYTKNYKQLRNAENVEIIFSMEEHTSWLPNTKWSVLKAYIINIILIK